MGLDRLLLDSDIPPAPTNSNGDESFDSCNMVIILVVVALLCALICALILNSVARCALRCTRSRLPDDHDDGAARRRGAAGLDKEALRQIPVAVYKSGMRIPAATECTICLGEFGQGEKIRILPRCNHGFHVTCIDKWLVLHSSCPTCRQPLVELEHKASTVGEEFVSVEIR